MTNREMIAWVIALIIILALVRVAFGPFQHF